MSKYIDLAEQIHAETRDQVYLDEVGEVLDWLDENPDQVPGRTITDSELETITHDLATYEGPVLGTRIRVHLAHIGVSVVPDPEPTNAELLDKDIQEVDLHLTSKQLAEALIERGWTKAPDHE